jgi:hypothetical protein
MNSRLLMKLVRIWWAGIKVFFRWSAFWIVLVILCFPAMALTGLVGDYASYVLGIIFFILIVPIVFYLTSKYLLLLPDNDQSDVGSSETTSDAPPVTPTAGGQRGKTLRQKIVISTLAVFLISFSLGGPDPVSQYALGFMAMVLCGVPLLILARRMFFKASANSMQTLLCILVCLVSVLSVQVWLLYSRAAFLADPFPDSVVSYVPPSASYSSFRMGNLWIAYLSNPGDASLNETQFVICSIVIPKTWRSDGSTWTLTFSDEDDTSIGIGSSSDPDETVWIDKQHKVTHLERVLNEEDVSLLWNHRHDENLKISSPDELLAFVKKLKAEQAASTAPPEAAR